MEVYITVKKLADIHELILFACFNKIAAFELNMYRCFNFY